MDNVKKSEHIQSLIHPQTGESFHEITGENISKVIDLIDRKVWEYSNLGEKFIFFELFKNIIERTREELLLNNFKITNNHIIHFECSPEEIKEGLRKKFNLRLNKEDDKCIYTMKHLITNAIVSIYGEKRTGLWNEDKLFSSNPNDYDNLSSPEENVGYVTISSVNNKDELLSIITDLFEAGRIKGTRVKTQFSAGSLGLLSAIYFPPLTFQQFRDPYSNSIGAHNNFFLYFLNDTLWSKKPHFQRFKQEYPDLAHALCENMQKIRHTPSRIEDFQLLQEDLYKAYLIMRNYNTSDRDLFS